MKDYLPRNARRDLAWLADNRCIREWCEIDGERGRFAVTTLDGRVHGMSVEGVRLFWLGVLSGWRAARTSAEFLAAVVSS